MKVQQIMEAPQTISASELATKARSLLLKLNTKHLVVLENDKLVGSLCPGDFLNLKVAKANIPCSSLASPVRLMVSKDQPILEIADLMLQAGAGVAVALERGKPVGIVNFHLLLKGFSEKKYSPSAKKVSDLKLRKESVKHDHLIGKAASKLETQAALPVLKGTAVVGVISSWDLFYHGHLMNTGHRIGRMMRTPAITVSPDDSVKDAAMKMVSRKVSILPVVKKGRLLGFVSEEDIVRSFVR